MEYTIAIADDHLLIAEALTDIIENFRQFRVIFTVENGKRLIEKLSQPKNVPDIVLLDINMPEMNGFETAAYLTEHFPNILILTLSMQEDEEALIRMIKCGAKGYLLKNVHRTELEKALEAVVAKGFYYPDWATSKMLMNIAKTDEEKSLPVKFNAREIEFLNFASTEMTYKQIAEKMFCSPRTVESYRDGLFEKLGVNTRVGLVVYAIKNNVIQI